MTESKRFTCKKLANSCDGSFVQLNSKEERAEYRRLAEKAPRYEEIYKRLAEYEDIGTVEELQEMKEKNVAKKPKRH